MKFRVKGRDAISGAAVETTLEGFGLEEVEKLARRKHIDRATFEPMDVREGPPPLPVSYEPARPIASPSLADRAAAIAVAQARDTIPVADVVGVAPPAPSRRSMKLAIAGIVALVAIIALARIDLGGRSAAVASQAAAPTPPPHFRLASVYRVRTGLDSAFGDQLPEIDKSLTKDGDPVNQITWVSRDEIRAILFAVGDESSPAAYSLTIPYRTGDNPDWQVATLARFAAVASGDDSGKEWGAWIRESRGELSRGNPVVFEHGNFRARIERRTLPEPGVSLLLNVSP